MNSIVDLIKNTECEFVGGTTDKVIEEAQQELKFQFPDSYREILTNFGIISIGSHEIYGLGVEGYLNVVQATQLERKRYPDLLEKYIVIQNLSIEGFLILLNGDGEVFECNNGKIKVISKSLMQYVQEEIVSKI
jgi:hypothetical protein